MIPAIHRLATLLSALRRIRGATAQTLRDADDMEAIMSDWLALEESVAAEHGKFLVLFLGAYSPIIGCDAHGLVVAWNPAAERVFGWTEEDVRGKSLSAFIIPDRPIPGHPDGLTYRQAHDAGLARLRAGGTPHLLYRRIKTWALRRDGSEFQAELTIGPARIGDEVIYWAYVRDAGSVVPAEDLDTILFAAGADEPQK